MERIKSSLRELETSGNLRKIPFSPEKDIIDLSGNDYLGFTRQTNELETEFLDNMSGKPLLFTSAASRLLSTRQDSHFALEEDLERVYGKSALLFNSGYHANVGLIGSLSSLPETLFLADKLVHASIIDGLKMSGNTFYRFRHNDLISLRKLIEKHIGEYKRIVIITESVFSMDGDRAPLSEIVKLKDEFPDILIYVDEAHAFGVFGNKGLGLTTTPGIREKVDIMVGTFGKAAASFGSFVICDSLLKEWFINTSRSFIFSTALPPVNIEWNRFMLRKIMEAEDRRGNLHNLAVQVRETVNRIIRDFAIPDLKFGISDTQIIPVITGSSTAALRLSENLRSHNILALAIRRPTVPAGTERLRISLHAGLTPENIECLKDSLELGISDVFL